MPPRNGLSEKQQLEQQGQSLFQQIYAAEWRNPEAKAANISLGIAIGTFVAGIAIFRNFGSAFVPAI